MQVFAKKEHCLVIFLDDLQWADSASLQLLKLLTNEENQGYLLLIGAYRDNEVYPAHPLILTLNEIRKTGAMVNTVTLQPLSQLILNQLVVDTLHSAENLAFPLSNLVYRKTRGNPFFTIQLLKSFHQDGLIEFNWEERCWQCYISQIHQETLTDNVVEFMVGQLKKLPESTQKVLKLAACIGNQFDLQTLAIVCQLPEVEVAVYLWTALQLVLIIPQSEIYKFFVSENNQRVNAENTEIFTYKFIHDRVQQAAYSLIAVEEKQATHYQIGRLLLPKISSSAKEEQIFAIVNQLNYGTTLITEESEREELAQLNLIASRKAKIATAYQVANEYVSVGLSLLGEESWQNSYEMTLELYELAAELSFLCGNLEQMEQFIELVIAQTHSLLEQANVYCMRIQAYTSFYKHVEAIVIGKYFLQNLGITLPESPTDQDIQDAIKEINELIGDRKIEDLVHLKEMTDPEKLAIIRIANSIMPSTYQTGSPLFSLLIFLSTKLSIQYGNTSLSPHSYACYGLIMCAILKDIDTGIQFGQLAFQVDLKLDNKVTKGETLFVLAAFILHHKAHIKETLSVLQNNYITSLEVGNLEHAGYSVSSFCVHSFWSNQPLVLLEQDARAYSNQLLKLNILVTYDCCRIIWQSILNLLGFGEDVSILSGEALQETELLSHLLSSDYSYGLVYFYLHKLVLCFWFEQIESANKYAVECKRRLIAVQGMVMEPVFYFYDSLIALAQLSPNSDPAAEILERVKQNQMQLQHWAYYTPINYQHKVDLVAAETYRVFGKNYEAGDCYDRAISGAKEHGYIQEEALSHELAAKFYLNWGKETIAAGYMQKAYYCYAYWGAKAKTDDLEIRYPQLLKLIIHERRLSFNPLETISSNASFQTSSSTYTSNSGSTSISDILDITSVLKAAQTISGSIELDQLVVSLTKIILENSGAKKSALILRQKDTWYIQAITSMNHQGDSPAHIETILEPQLLDTCPDIPIKIINYVINTQEIIVIDNYQTNIPGLMGTYMLDHQPKSILCKPIIHQGHLVGILYLENQLTSGVFTHERLQVIHLLSSQAAISLENARLYQQAQQALENLQQAQLQIVQSEKMSALGNLVARCRS